MSTRHVCFMHIPSLLGKVSSPVSAVLPAQLPYSYLQFQLFYCKTSLNSKKVGQSKWLLSNEINTQHPVYRTADASLKGWGALTT